MRKLLTILFALLISACSKEKDTINCQKASILNTIVEMEKNETLHDIIVILGHKSIAENATKHSLINKCIMAKVYKEDAEIAKALYDSRNGNRYVFTYYYTKQIENCLGELLTEKLNIISTSDADKKANDFRAQYSIDNCSNLLNNKN